MPMPLGCCIHWSGVGCTFPDPHAAFASLEQAQVKALKEIAVEERAYILSLNVLESRGVDEFHRVEARRRLVKEHPEAFR